MEIETVNHTLLELGFDQKEIQVYLAMLKIGEASVTKISQETGIERTLIYYIIDKLMNKGMASFKLRNNVKYYTATSPEKILEDAKEREKSFRNILPYLIDLQKQDYEEPVKVDIYKGDAGLQACLNDLFKCTKEVMVLGEQGQFQTSSSVIFKQYMRKLIETGTKEKVIVREDWRGKVWKTRNSTYKHISKNLISPTTTVLYSDKVLISVWEKPMFHILIKNKKIADSYKAYFNHFWKIAKK